MIGGFFQQTSGITYVPALNQTAAEMRAAAIASGALSQSQAALVNAEHPANDSQDDK